MSRLAAVFWGVVALDALLLAVMLVLTLKQRGPADGGREMALFFFIAVPTIVLVVASLLFHFSDGRVAKFIALFIVAVPGLFYAKTRIDSVLIDRDIAAYRAGVGYFKDDRLRILAAAVVQRDLATLKRLARGADLNTVGDRGMTLLALAVEPDPTGTPGTVVGDDWPVVRALLAAGAHPDQGLDAAVRRDTPALLTLLLDAGANPNLLIDGEALVFRWKSVITPQTLRLLAAHGLDLNSLDRGDPLPVVLTIYRRWDLLAVLIELGADTARPRPDGRHVAGELAHQIAEERDAGREPPAALLHAQALLATSAPPR